MAHILIITQELTGRVNSFCELGRRLEVAGHRVTVTSPVDIAGRVQDRGLEFRPLSRLKKAGEAGEPVLRVPPRRALRQLLELRDRRANRDGEVESLDLNGWVEGMRELDPDLVLCDFELPMQVIITGGLGLPIGLLSDQMSLYKRPGIPPLHHDVAPGEGWAGSRLGIEFSWAGFRAWKWLRFQLLRMLSGGRDELTVLHEVARRVGYNLRDEAQPYQWSVPVTFRTLPVFVLNARELEFPHAPPGNVDYVGPVIDHRPVPGGADGEEQLARVLSGGGRTLIYGGFGVYHRGDDSAFLRRVMQAVAMEPTWDLVIGLGGRLDRSGLGPIPANVHLLDWAPQQRILEQADIALLHGGITSVNEAIVNGVPMVVYPYDYNDTPGYAARVRYHGLGVTGDREAASAGDIHAHIAAVLTDPRIRTNVARMQNAFARYGNRAVEAVEGLLAR